MAFPLQNRKSVREVGSQAQALVPGTCCYVYLYLCICAPVDLRIFLCICAFLYLCICFVVCVPRTSYPPPDMEFVQKFKPPDFQATQVAGAWTERQKMFHGGSFLKLADDDV